MIEYYLNEFKEAGISVQVTQEINMPTVVHAINHNGVVHRTKSEIPSIALEKMKRKLIG